MIVSEDAAEIIREYRGASPDAFPHPDLDRAESNLIEPPLRKARIFRLKRLNLS